MVSCVSAHHCCQVAWLERYCQQFYKYNYLRIKHGNFKKLKYCQIVDCTLTYKILTDDNDFRTKFLAYKKLNLIWYAWSRQTVAIVYIVCGNSSLQLVWYWYYFYSEFYITPLVLKLFSKIDLIYCCAVQSISSFLNRCLKKSRTAVVFVFYGVFQNDRTNLPTSICILNSVLSERVVPQWAFDHGTIKRKHVHAIGIQWGSEYSSEHICYDNK